MPAKKTTAEFIEDARKVHGDKYDYSNVEYSNSSSKVKITCIEHGVFEQTPNNHLNGQNCPMCKGVKKHTKSSFISKARETHGHRFDYSKVDYVGNKVKVEIICRDHGVFEQTPKAHLKGDGCSKCGGVWKKNTPAFIKAATEIHKGIYDYTLTEYRGNKVKVIIMCRKCGCMFRQTPNSHLNGSGCNKCCVLSKGEASIESALKKLGVVYEAQKRFEACKRKKPLPFDFHIPAHKCLIEYDGVAHFRAVDYFGGEKALKVTQQNDTIKTEFARKNGFKLLRIKYTEFERIEEIITCALKGNQTIEKRPMQLKLFDF